jgi:hypothetical protein
MIVGFQICLQSIDCAYILQDEEKIIEHVNTVLMPMDPNVHQMTDQRSTNKTGYQMRLTSVNCWMQHMPMS